MNSIIKKIIQFLKSKFERPEFWLVVDTPLAIIFKWFVWYGLLSIILIIFGLFMLQALDLLFSKQFFVGLFGGLVSGVSLFYGISLFYLALYNILYFLNIHLSGHETVGIIRNVKSEYKSVRGTDLSSLNFEVAYKAQQMDEQPIFITIPTRVYKSHRYAHLIEEDQKIVVKYWKKDPKKAKVIWRKS